jgi:hypothetical protein
MIMAKPPPSGAHSDIKGVNMDARVNTPTRDGDVGNAKELDDADELSVAKPDEGEAGVSNPTD